MRVPSVLSVAIVVFVVCTSHVEQVLSGYSPQCGCPPGSGGGNPPPGGHPGKPPCKQQSLFEISNTITCKLLKEIIGTNNKYESFAVSAFNIFNALLLVDNAACKQTLQQLLNYQSICDLMKINQQFKNYLPQLQLNVTQNDDLKALIRTFAGLFPANNHKLRPRYVSKMKRIYRASVQTVPYATNGSKALNIINSQISKATNGFYREFFQSEFDPATELVLCDTLYLQISWQYEYFYLTSKASFYQPGVGSVASVPYMNNGGGFGDASYASFDGCEFVQIPTYVPQFTYVAFYPQNCEEDPAVYLRTLTAAKIEKIFEALENVRGCQVNVTIPQSTVASTYNLAEYFEANGVTDLFQRANLCRAVKPSPISNKLRATELVHKASVTVNKDGLTAVASTAIVVGIEAVGTCENKLPQFFADRPYAYFVADKNNKLVLFSGLMYNPTN